MDLLNWQSLLAEGLDGWQPDDPRVWSREGDSLVVDAAGLNQHNALTYREGTWSDFDLIVHATLVHGANLQIHFGISDDHPTAYVLDWLKGLGKMALSTQRPGAKTRCANSLRMRSSRSESTSWYSRSMGLR